MPFSQAIMNAIIPTNFMTPKITFTSIEDLEAHITAFHTLMMISRGTNDMHFKLFMGTFSGTTLDWFISLPDGHITSFDKFSTLFREQFIVNRAPPSPHLLRYLQCETIPGRALERLPEPVWGTGGKVAHQRRSHDGARLQAGNVIRTFQ